jgi:hypothetical protein
MTDSSERSWRPWRFSIRAILLATLALCCLLAYRLQPLVQARKFAAAGTLTNEDHAMELLPSASREVLRQHLYKLGTYTWNPRVDDTPWQVLLSGKCHVVVDVRWSRYPSHGMDQVTVEFVNRDPITVRTDRIEQQFSRISVL